jgi:hypothetical protein
VDYFVPQELHDYFDYAPVTKRPIEREELSSYQRELLDKTPSLRSEKLFPFLGAHQRVTHHVALLKFWVKLGVKVTAVRRIWSFKQTCWLK